MLLCLLSLYAGPDVDAHNAVAVAVDVDAHHNAVGVAVDADIDAAVCRVCCPLPLILASADDAIFPVQAEGCSGAVVSQPAIGNDQPRERGKTVVGGVFGVGVDVVVVGINVGGVGVGVSVLRCWC